MHSIFSTFLSFGGGVYIPFFLFRFINGFLCAVLVMMRLIRTGQAFFFFVRDEIVLVAVVGMRGGGYPIALGLRLGIYFGGEGRAVGERAVMVWVVRIYDGG